MNTVIVTGASNGIGLSISRLFLEKGYSVIGTYNSSSPTDYGCDYFKCDVSQIENLKSLVEYTMKKYNKIDVIVNCAGVCETGIIQNIAEEKIDYLTDVNLKAPYFLIKYAAPYMIKAQKGSIVNISSIWGNAGASCEVIYSATKGGINAMTKALAKELAPSGIRVNAVAPGVIKTRMLDNYTDNDLNELKILTPLDRLGNPDDVAKAVLFMAEAEFITGQILTVDGGFSL